MRKIRVLSILLIMCLVFATAAPSAFAIDYPTVDAQAFVVADMVSGNILYSQNMDQLRAPASLTKIMTGLIAVEAVESGRVSLDDMIEAGADCRVGLDEDSSNVDIFPGEVMSYKDLLYCALVHSANEACNILATAVSGDINSFVAEMNAKAMELGATSTCFLDTNGLTNDVNRHHTTAYDLFIIANEAMKHPLFASIVNTTHYETAPTNVSGARELSNSNALMCTDGFYGPNYIYEGAHGIKTGYTKAAGYCLVSTATRNDVEIMCIVMGCNGWLNAQINDYGNFSTTIKLYNWAFDNFSYRTVITAGDVVEKADVKYAQDGEQVVIRASETARLLIPNDATESDIYIDVDIFEDRLVAPIEPKTILGEAEIYVKGAKSGKMDLVTMDSIKMDKKEISREKFKEFISAGWLKAVFIIIVVALVIYIFFTVRYKLKRMRQRRRREEAAEKKKKEQMLQRQRAQMEANRWAQEGRHTTPRRPDVPAADNSDATRSYTTISPAARELDQDELDAIIRSLGLDKHD